MTNRAVTRPAAVVLALATTLTAGLGAAGCSRPAAGGGADSAAAAAQAFLRALGTKDAGRFCALLAVGGRVATQDDIARCEQARLLDGFVKTTATTGLAEAVVSGVNASGPERAALDPAQVGPPAAQDFVGRAGGAVVLVKLGERWYVSLDAR